MRPLFLFILLSVSAVASSFTEFYVQSTGSNLNAGSTTGNSAAYTYASGSWVASTGVFTVASGNPQTDGVVVGDWASVYADGSTVTGFVGRVTARTTTTITVSLTAKSGAAPTDGTSNRTLKIGGAWAGPSGTVDFPFGFASGLMQNATGNAPRVYFLAGETYSITDNIAHNVDGPTVFDAYSVTPGDQGGRVTLQGPASGTSFTLLNVTSFNNTFSNIVFDRNGSTSAADLVTVNAAENMFFRCVFKNSRRAGIYVLYNSHYVECEATSNNLSGGTTLNAGFAGIATGSSFTRCISHNNTAANTDGWHMGNGFLIECIAYDNARHGFRAITDKSLAVLHCDAYNNGGDGLFFTETTTLLTNIQNSNFVKNGGYGIEFTGTIAAGTIYNNRFGAGTQANTSGTISTVHGIEQKDNSSYANDVTPWADPTTGDFRLTLAAAQNVGRGTFLRRTAGGYTVAITSAPDIGAAPQLQSGGGGGGASGSINATTTNAGTVTIQ